MDWRREETKKVCNNHDDYDINDNNCQLYNYN